MTKNDVLIILKNSADYVSGEDMSRNLFISRTAVNAAVKALRKDGYKILSATNRGYLLQSSPDILSAGELLANLPASYKNRIVYLDSVDSTNNYLKLHANADVPGGLIVAANEQTGGRGRHGRSFQCVKDKGVYLSMQLRLDCSPSDATAVTACTAVAVSDSIETVCGKRPDIKWVNDLIMNGKKVCGILTEMSVESEDMRVSQIISGIGVNVNQSTADFSRDIRSVASSIAVQTGVKVNRAELACEIIKNMDKMQNSWPQNKQYYLDAYRKDCIIIGKKVLAVRNGGTQTGTAESIDDNFRLEVSFEDGHKETILSGEVSVKGLY